MNIFEDETVAEVRKRREELLDEYGGMEGYLKHIEKDRPRWEREGWKFVDINDMLKKKHTETPANVYAEN
jgi:hypothetical protein